MTDEELVEFSRLLRLNAAKFRLSALPGAWPEWMTLEKRQSMADNFERYAVEVDAMLSDRVAPVYAVVDRGSGDMNVEVEMERLPDGRLQVNAVRYSDSEAGQ